MRQVVETFAKLPLAFIPNAGQTKTRAHYYTQGPGYSFAFTRDRAVLAFRHDRLRLALSLRFIAANPRVQLRGEQRLQGRVNYLVGNDPAEWHTRLPTYARVVYRDLWPGIDMVFRGENGRLTYEFRVQPGARPREIRLAYDGAQALSLERSGNLRIRTSFESLTDTHPRSYQVVAGRRIEVASRFVLSGSGSHGFAIAHYDPRRLLVIDPGLSYSTFLGGSNLDEGHGIALDLVGNAYLTGTTFADFPTTPGAFDTNPTGSGGTFVAKVNSTGSSLVYSTLLGPSSGGTDIAVNSAGEAYVTGDTSSGFPTTPGAFDTTFNGHSDAFVAKLSPTGSSLVYSSFLGGRLGEEAFGIALDAAGNAYVTGLTESPAGNSPPSGFPTTPGAFDTSPNSGHDAFVTKLNGAGSLLVYSTVLGAGGLTEGRHIAVDAAGSAYVTGHTDSAGFPTTAGAFDRTQNGSADAFVTKLNGAGSSLVYSTFLGGSDSDGGYGIAIDGAGAAHVTGDTHSSGFPTTSGAFDTSIGGGGFGDGFATKLNPAGSSLLYSTFLGGSNFDAGYGIALDAAGDAYVSGATTSADFPTSSGAFDTTLNAGGDAFLAKLSPTGSIPLYSTLFGGSGLDVGLAVTVDAAGDSYVTGGTESAAFPTTPGALDASQNGNRDAFLIKFSARSSDTLDHFQCYEVTPGPFTPRTVVLGDQFGARTANVTTPRSLCTPVSKNENPIRNRAAHLFCYSLAASKFNARHVLVYNQFAPQGLRLDVFRPVSLCLPSAKSTSSKVTPTVPKRLDHYLCYSAKPRQQFMRPVVRLLDQFGRSKATVVRPETLCAPVSKNRQPIRNKRDHLLCYLLHGKPSFRSRIVFVTNQFGRRVRADILRPRTLCVPTSKRVQRS